VIGTTAAITAAALTPYPYYGAAYYSLPGGCGGYPYYGHSYYRCDGYYLEPRYEGDTIVYVNVPDPASAEGKASQQGKTTSSAPVPSPSPAPVPDQSAPTLAGRFSWSVAAESVSGFRACHAPYDPETFFQPRMISCEAGRR
jgi:hypothetical protein